MAPPEVGSEILVSTKARITSHNEDGTFNVKIGNRRGRPFKKSKADIVPPPLPLIAAVPPPPRSGKEDGCTDGQQTGSRGRLLSWASFLTVGGAVVLGMFHGVGTKIVDIVWPYLRALLRFVS